VEAEAGGGRYADGRLCGFRRVFGSCCSTDVGGDEDGEGFCARMGAYLGFRRVSTAVDGAEGGEGSIGSISRVSMPMGADVATERVWVAVRRSETM